MRMSGQSPVFQAGETTVGNAVLDRNRGITVFIRDCRGQEAFGDKVACAQGKDGHAVSINRRSTLTVLRQANDIDIELQPLPGLEVLLLLQ
jgi:hypothetical protein